MGTKERREREKLDTRERILATARDMFATEGYESVTMRAIANHIEYTPTALYHHFDSKQALLSELCERDFESLARAFASKAVPEDPIERLKAIGETYLRFAEEYPSQYRFMFMTVFPVIEQAPGIIEARENPERNAYAFLRGACVEAIEDGRLRPELTDADQIAQILWSSIHGLVSLRITKHHQEFVPWKDLRETALLSMDLLMHGMLRQA